MHPTPPLHPEQRLQARVVPYWLLGDGVGALLLTGLVWYFVRPWLQQHWDGWSGTIEDLLLVVCTLWLAQAVALPPLSYVRWRYGFVGDLLLLRYGVFFVEERAVPVRRMQHVDLLRGPIERLFGLATLVVYTAGNEGSAFRVPGLNLTTAQELRDRIVQMRGEQRV